ncbi:MAG: branched-chain amino acid ABC transporter substrate-binding protein [Thermodesulfobacteriota bacterium]
MRRLAMIGMLVGGVLFVAGFVQAEPLRIGIVESLSGPQTLVGKQTVTAVQFVVEKVNAQGGFNGSLIEIKEYDNQGGTSGAADKVKAAIADGVQIVVQGASSAIASQVTEDIRKHNLRNPGKELIYLNVGAEALVLCGEKCHFHHFRFNPNADIRVNALAAAMKETGDLGTRVYSINQNYAWGQDMENAIVKFAPLYGYTVIGKVLHDVNRIQDFSPYVAKIKAANPDSVITGNWSNDLLLLMKATSEAGLKVRFGMSVALDSPGNIANAGETAMGHYLSSTFSIEAGGEAGARYAEDFKKFSGHYPAYFEPVVTHAIQFLAAALKKVNFNKGKINANQIAFALEETSIETSNGSISMRKEDHQALIPIVVCKVTHDAKYKLDGTDMGLKPIKVIRGPQAISPLQDSCKMQRPNR